MPAILSENGVKDILNLKLSDDEQAKFDRSYEVLMKMKKEIDEIIK